MIMMLVVMLFFVDGVDDAGDDDDEKRRNEIFNMFSSRGRTGLSTSYQIRLYIRNPWCTGHGRQSVIHENERPALQGHCRNSDKSCFGHTL